MFFPDLLCPTVHQAMISTVQSLPCHLWLTWHGSVGVSGKQSRLYWELTWWLIHWPCSRARSRSTIRLSACTVPGRLSTDQSLAQAGPSGWRWLQFPLMGHHLVAPWWPPMMMYPLEQQNVGSSATSVSGITLAAPNPSLPRQRLFTWWLPQKVESPSNRLPSKQGFQSPRYHGKAGHS